MYFRPSPQPSSEPTDTAQRYKSGGHHTEGFDTREAALVSAQEIADKISAAHLGAALLSVEKDFSWDGKDIPAMVVFFAVDDNQKAVPLF